MAEIRTSTDGLLPAALEQWLQRVRGPFHPEIVEQFHGFECFALRIEPYAKLLEHVFVRADQDELRALAIQEVGGIDRNEAATVKPLAEPLRQVRPVFFG
jgi:hypothetical protein